MRHFFNKLLKKIGFDSFGDFGSAILALFVVISITSEIMKSYIFGFVWILVSTFVAYRLYNEKGFYKHLYEKTIEAWVETDKKITDLTREPTREEVITSLIERELTREQIDKFYRRIQSGFWVVPKNFE